MLKDGMAKVPDGSVYIVPEDDETNGHGTTFNAAYYSTQLAAFMKALPHAPD